MNIKTIEGNFDNLEVNQLLVNHFKELRSVSPKNSCHVLDINGLKTESIKFWSLWENNELIGCGALKLFDETHGEFKSIRVSDKFRNKKYGGKIISHLIEKSKQIGITKLSVETGAGDFFAPARKLFKSFGFKECGPFAHYKDDPNSCYYSVDI